MFEVLFLFVCCILKVRLRVNYSVQSHMNSYKPNSFPLIYFQTKNKTELQRLDCQ